MSTPTPNRPLATSGDASPDVAGNAGIAMFASAFYLVSRLILPPLVLSHITLMEYGLWSACFVLIMYIGLSDVGFSNVYVRFAARYHARGDTPAINRLLSTGMITLTGMAMLVLLGLWLALPHVLDFLNVQPQQRGTAAILVMGAAAMFLLDMSLGGFCYLLHGLQRIREEKKVALVGYALEPALILLFLLLGAGVYSLLAAFVLRYAWSLGAFIRLAHRYLPGLEIRLHHYDRSMLRHFFGFGLAVQASALLGTVLFSIDRVLAGLLLGPKGIALFELGAKLPVAAMTIPSTISNVTMPAAARHAANDDTQAISGVYRQSSRAISLIAGLPLGFMALFAGPIGLAWLGERDDLAALPLILTLTALWSHLHITTGPGSAVFRATGCVANEFVYHGLRISLVATGIGLSMLHQGATATALVVGLAGGSATAALGYMMHNQLRMGLSVRALFRDILLPGFIAYPLAAILKLVWLLAMPPQSGRWETLAGLLAFGMTYTLIWAYSSWHLLQPHEQSWLRQRLSPLATAIPGWRNS